MARKKRTAYTLADRKKILAAAISEKLTAEQVKKKFGVTPVTYYSWRKKYGAARKRGAKSAAAPRATRAAAPRAVAAIGLGGIGAQVRSAVQARVQSMVHDIVRAEVETYLGSLFGGGTAKGGRRRRPRKKK